MIAHLVAYLDMKQSADLSNRPTHGLGYRFWRWCNRRRGAEDMRMLPDYLLRDIGISRDEIEAAARGAYIRPYRKDLDECAPQRSF